MGELMIGLYVFVLATLAGREVITKVPPTLHTPLMSGANAISGIAIVGALVVAAARRGAGPDGPRRRGHRDGHDQRGRRLPGDRPHARHVQEEVGSR